MPRAKLGQLFRSELALVERSVAQRRREFSAGRYHARRALSRLGRSPEPILAGPDRAPAWPADVVGSISHCATFCGAIVGSTDDVVALGFDVEEHEPVPAELVPIICSPEELAAAAESANCPAEEVAKLIFSIKESVFKAYYPASGSFLEFHEVSVALNWRNRAFLAVITAPGRPSVFGRRQIGGRFGFAGGIVFAVAWASSRDS